MSTPLTPPPELIEQWEQQFLERPTINGCFVQSYIAAKAAQWGADRELEMCIEVLGGQWEWDVLSQCTGWKEFRDQSEDILRATRRPEPPSLKEQALDSFEFIGTCHAITGPDWANIRRALEALDD